MQQHDMNPDTKQMPNAGLLSETTIAQHQETMTSALCSAINGTLQDFAQVNDGLVLRELFRKAASIGNIHSMSSNIENRSCTLHHFGVGLSYCGLAQEWTVFAGDYKAAV